MRCRFDLARGVVVSDGLNGLKDEDIQKLVKLIESLESSAFDYLQLQVGDVKVTIGKGAVPMNAQPAAPAGPALAASHGYPYAPAPGAPSSAVQMSANAGAARTGATLPAGVAPEAAAPMRAHADSMPGDAAPAASAHAPPRLASVPATAHASPPRSSSVAAPSSLPDQAPPVGKDSAGAAAVGTIEIKAQIMGMFYAQPEPGAPPFVTNGAEVKEDTTVCLIEVMKTFNAMTAGMKGVITEICAENAQLVEYGQVLVRVRPA